MVCIKKLKDGHYLISGLNLKNNLVYEGPWDTCQVEHSQDLHLYFENGNGGNGLTVEALQAVIVDQLEATQPGSKTLEYAKAALAKLQS